MFIAVNPFLLHTVYINKAYEIKILNGGEVSIKQGFVEIYTQLIEGNVVRMKLYRSAGGGAGWGQAKLYTPL